MQQEHYEYQSEFARRYVAQGRAEGEAKGLLLALEIKGFEVSDALRERISNCTDAAQLDAWYSRVKSAQRLEDIFG